MTILEREPIQQAFDEAFAQALQLALKPDDKTRQAAADTPELRAAVRARAIERVAQAKSLPVDMVKLALAAPEHA